MIFRRIEFEDSFVLQAKICQFSLDLNLYSVNQLYNTCFYYLFIQNHCKNAYEDNFEEDRI